MRAEHGRLAHQQHREQLTILHGQKGSDLDMQVKLTVVERLLMEKRSCKRLKVEAAR